MVDQALSLVQGDQLVRQTELKPVQLAPLVSDVLLLLAAKASARRVDVQSQVPDDAWVIGHGQLVHEVVVNLISNAIKYTPAGKVILSMAWESGRLSIAVRDTGPGRQTAR